MKREVIITPEKIDEVALNKSRSFSDQMGAVITFLGVVRATEGSAKIKGLHYEAFHEMAEHQFKVILDQVESRWPIESVRIVHRTGFVAANEASLWIEVISPHRGEAFGACRFIIEEMKKVVPIWKRAVE